ncbi:MAG: MlaD family protein, partial [Actinomycetota bacterium]|nr:MlaD family protein [Actinomycetota bacterium]
MKRVLLIALVLVAAGAGAFVAAGAGDDDSRGRYTVVLDNAFGLIEGADVKVAGVRAGKITSFGIDPKSYRARVGIKINARGFGDLRSDVFCESRPQSLIGEYFLDCKPGTSPRELKPGAVIPVERTGSTIPVDLVNNIMRRPFRERFSILLGELGAAFASRGADLNETIRRANPALRETDKVLRILAEQRSVIRDLTANADRVVGELAANKTEVTRFVREARDTARTSASRKADLREQVETFPAFLDELRPTMARLGEAADAQVPALTNMSRSAPLLRSFFDELGPFSDASRPAFRTLADASRAGRTAVRVARPRIAELRAFVDDLPELATNLAITLEHLDDRRFAVEKDPRSPGGQGFTGFEAILQYVFRQSQATNVFDANSYLLKVSAFLDSICANYTNAELARTPERQRCRARLGPSQPGIDQPDPTKSNARKARSGDRDAEREGGR